MHSSTRLPDRCHNSSRPVSFSLGVLTQMHNALSILPPKRGRTSLHSFSIRDLFLVTVIVALVLGWWLDRSRLANRADQLFRTAQTFANQLRWKGAKI